VSEGANQRKTQRRRAILVGRVFDDTGKSGKCMITDMSVTGAKVKCDTGFEIGAEVYLKIDKFNDLRRAEVMWLREGYTGLRFTREITRPPAAMAAFLSPILDH